MKKGIWSHLIQEGTGTALKARRADLRRRNKWLLLHLIQARGPSSQAELARQSELSPATVSGILQPLIEAQILVEEGKTTAGIGRKGSVLAFNPRKVLAAGVSIDQEECEVALVDLSDRVIDHATTAYPRYTEPHQVVAQAVACLHSLMAGNKVDPDTVIGVGVAIPGLVNPDTGVLAVASNLGWHNVDLRALFERQSRLPVRVEHLGRAKARAESVWGKGEGYRNFVCLEIGSGIGAGVMVDGSVLRGARASAGEVGHMPIDPDGPQCTCGLRGCWEAFCASPAIRRRLADRLSSPDCPRSSLSPNSTLAQIGQAAVHDDPVARFVLEETATHLARGLVGLIWHFDPEIVILSGPVVRDCPMLIEMTQANLRGVTSVRAFDVPLTMASQEPDEGVVAAAGIVSFQYIEELASSDLETKPSRSAQTGSGMRQALR